ncbi:restriction endonuclease subunit S [Flavobacterium caeni]|nr:restriction endonuclease subunit S [Flavobacterium caeni]
MELPEDWTVKKIGDIGKVYNGNSINEQFKRDNFLGKNGTPFIATKDVGFDGAIDYNNGVNIPDYRTYGYKVAPADTPIICVEGGSAGRKVGFVDRDVCFGNKLFAVVPYGEVIPKYLYYFYLSEEFQRNFSSNLLGIIGGVSSVKFKGIQIVYPSINEQHHIVSILNQAFTAIDRAKSNLEKNLQNAKDLFQSELDRVFREKGDDWEEKTLKSVTTKIGSGATPRGGKENYKDEGISLVRSMNVHDGVFVRKNLAFIDSKQANDLNNVVIEKDDVLLNITGASIARTCIVPDEIIPARVNQHVSIIRTKKDLLTPAFLNLLLIAEPYKKQILSTGEKGSTRQAITKAQLEEFEIHFPNDLRKQEDVVSKLKEIENYSNRLKFNYTQKLQNLEQLKKAILQKAFTGQLTNKEVTA